MNEAHTHKRYSLLQNSLFNTVGTIVYFFCQWLISLLIVRMGSTKDVSDLQLAMSVSNIFLSVASYNMRPFQVSDVKGEYRASDYIASRILTCGAALAGCLGYCLWWGYGGVALSVIMLYMMYRLNESVSDVLHGIDQLHDRMDHVCWSYVIRGILTAAGFGLVFRFTGNLLLSILFILAATNLVVLTYDTSRAARYDSVRPVFRKERLTKLLLACLPAVLSTAALTAIVTVPRQHLLALEGETVMGYYATVATPVAIIQVLMTGLLNPAIGRMAGICEARDRKGLLLLMGRIALLIGAVGALAFGALAALGEPVMALMYGEVIRPYVPLMYAVMGCALLFALCAVFYNILVVMRKMIHLLAASGLALALAALTGREWIARAGADGVSFCVISGYLLFLLLCGGAIWQTVTKWKAEK